MVSVSEDGFERLGREVGGLGLPTLIVQEGGYYIDGLESNARRFFTGLGAA
ncbi:Acetylpolyamine aminohydrolase [compost metagenome]